MLNRYALTVMAIAALLGTSVSAATMSPILPFDPNPPAPTAGVDFDDNSPTQAGFLGIPASNNKSYNVTHNGITFDMVLTNANLGNVNRDRGATWLGKAVGDLERDFEQWYGNTGLAPEFTLTLTGLVPSAVYDISVWHMNNGAGHNSLNFHDGASSADPLIGTSSTTGNANNFATWQTGSVINTTSDGSGQIVLTAVAPSPTSRININGIAVNYVVPEPASLAMGLVGLTMLAARRRRS